MAKRRGIHFARVENSPRLRRFLKVLRDGRPHTTREIIHEADVCNTHTCKAEFKAQDYDIQCEPAGKPFRRGTYFYWWVQNG